MHTLEHTLVTIRTSRPELFDEEARRPPSESELQVAVVDVPMPRPDEFNANLHNEQPLTLPLDDGDEWWAIEPDEEDYEEETPRSVEERRAFEHRPRRAGVELLAVYLPFHFYPAGHWGIRFFERPMKQFADRLHLEFARRGRKESRTRVLKMTTYAVGRHEFQHYLTELEALDLELKQGRSIYRPYWEHVYKRTYPNADCLEETVATVWKWDNPVIRSPVAVQQIFRDALRRNPFSAYSNGAALDSTSVRTVEDALTAQLSQCVRVPRDPPPVWGSLPRPYVQPWTRYENVRFMMNRSYGGRLGAVLNAGPIRRTIRIYHR